MRRQHLDGRQLHGSWMLPGRDDHADIILAAASFLAAILPAICDFGNIFLTYTQ